MQNIYDLSYNNLETLILDRGQKRFRARQIWEGLYKQLYSSWDDFSSISKPDREILKSQFFLSSIKELGFIDAKDAGTRKSLFRLNDGNLIESVLLKKKGRFTLCVSTQSGCPVGCIFCASGKMGFKRNLTAGEIIEQVLFFQRYLYSENFRLTNIVYMGMGEPFLNYENCLTSVHILNHQFGFNLGARRITISTIGIIDKIFMFADEKIQVNLSISLHAPDDDIRKQLVPLAKNTTVEKLVEASSYYFKKTGRRVTFEYVLIKGINDHPEHALKLAEKIRNLNCHINLIALNPTTHYDGISPDKKTIREFGRILLENNINLTIRDSQGSEIGAGCGQLAGKLLN